MLCNNGMYVPEQELPHNWIWHHCTGLIASASQFSTFSLELQVRLLFLSTREDRDMRDHISSTHTNSTHRYVCTTTHCTEVRLRLQDVTSFLNTRATSHTMRSLSSRGLHASVCRPEWVSISNSLHVATFPKVLHRGTRMISQQHSILMNLQASWQSFQVASTKIPHNPLVLPPTPLSHAQQHTLNNLITAFALKKTRGFWLKCQQAHF